MKDTTPNHCPECGAVPGNPCTYLPIAGGPDRYVRSPAVQALIDKVGTPTKRNHGARGWSEKHRLRAWLKENGRMFWEMNE